MKIKFASGLVLTLFAWAVQAACPVTPGRFVANGAEVTDTTTGLVWARCSLGQAWNGTSCTGAASLVYHERALVLAQSAVGWRLPNVKELASIVDRRCKEPATDSAAFPNISSYYFWASTIELWSSVDSAWYVDFSDGKVYFKRRSGDYFPAFHGAPGYTEAPSVAVRLVRASQ